MVIVINTTITTESALLCKIMSFVSIVIKLRINYNWVKFDKESIKMYNSYAHIKRSNNISDVFYKAS